MNRYTNIFIVGVALAVGALTMPSCSVEPVCDLMPQERKPTVEFDGTVPKYPVTGSYKLSGSISSKVALESLTVGGVRPTTAANNFQSWEITLTQEQLQANRVGNVAKIKVVAVTVCDAIPITLDNVLEIPIGPSSNEAISVLNLGEIQAPSDECYLPKNSSQAAIVRVSSDPEFVGTSVKVTATNAKVSPEGDVKLVDKDGMAIYDLTLTGNSAGFAVVSASALGVSAEPKSIVIADAPQIVGNNATAERGVPYSLYVSTMGNLATCRVEVSHAGAATAEVLEPAIGPIIGVTSVLQPKDCTQTEVARVAVSFAADAPTGAQITLRCSDTWGQEGAATVKVSGDPLVPITGLDVVADYPLDECYLPANGSVAATVKVTADPSFVGAMVKVVATSGMVTPAESFKLIGNGSQAFYDLSFTGKQAGVALLTAIGPGATADPEKVLVAGPPTISPSTGSAKRGLPYSLYVMSDGNLATCSAQATHPSSVALEVAEPQLGPITGIKSVKEANTDCSIPEMLRVNVTFAADAPDGSQVTLRCLDTWGQVGQSTITVIAGP